MLVENQKVKVIWNNGSRKHYISCGYKYTKNGEEFEIDISDISKGSKALVKFECDWCGIKFDRSYQTGIRATNQFCTHNCSVKYNSKTKLEARPWKKCEWCNSDYQVPYYAEETSRFCCRECLTSWQSINFSGKGSSRYVERVVVNCDWCRAEILRTPSYVGDRTYNFCDMTCKRNWHREVYVKTDGFLEIVKNTMINNLVDGKISFTQSKPQLILNELLTKQEINFTNELPLGDFAFDTHLTDHDLLIEVNGGYWHCDSRFYDEINYDIQLNRIISDKRKRTFIKNKFKKNILYLWEFDIETNLQICLKLIENFIENKGKLKNYHSFNYHINVNGELQLENDIISPYMDWSAEKLASIVNLEVRERVNGYQPDKHITFECEYCGNNKTQSITTYIRAKNHFCSIKCKNLSQQIGNNTCQLSFIHQCDNCHTDVELPNHRHLKIISGEQKNTFCSNECKAQWQSDNLVGKNNPNYTQLDRICEYCSEEYTVPLNQKDRNRYCSVECRQKAQRNRIIVKCLNCNEDVEKTPTDLSKNKTGEYFCSHECRNEYRTKSKNEIRNCEYCAEGFETKKKSKQRFCCISCRNKGIAIANKPVI